MTQKQKLSGTTAVQDFLDRTEHPLKKVMEAIRTVVLAVDTEIAEQIKWNAPAFYYKGEMKEFDPKDYKRDLLVFNLRKNDHVLLVFPTGAVIEDKSGLLEGNYPDGRRMAKFHSLDEVKKRKADLQNIISEWLSKLEK